MKARNPSTGNLETVYVKALDSLPVGAEIDFDGDSADIPDGWEQVSGKSLVAYELYNNVSGSSANITLDINYKDYDYIIVTNSINAGILDTNNNEVTITASQFIDVLYHNYDVIEFTYNSSTQQTTISHTRQGSYYNNANHSSSNNIYKMVGIKLL